MSIEDNKIEDNKALIRRYIEEVWNQGNLTALYACFEANLVAYNTLWVSMWRKALPNVRMWVDAMVAEGDYVAVHLTLRGTHLGELKGELINDFMTPMTPTGRQVDVASIVIYEISNNKIVHVPYSVMDWLTLLHQLS